MAAIARAMDPAAVDDGVIKTAMKTRSGKNTPGQKRQSGKHKPGDRGKFKTFVASRAAVALHDFQKQQTDQQNAELNALRKRVATLGVEVDAANKERFKAVAALGDKYGARVASVLTRG